jgi:DNA-binding transcriptional LysR family regulator
MPLQEDRLSVALSKSHALASQARIALKSLAEQPLVMSSRQVSPNYFDLLTSVCRAHGFAPRVLHEVRSVTSQIAYVSCGQGVALVPHAVRKLAPENVVVRPLKEKVMVVTATAAWNAKRHHPMVDAAVAWLRSQHAPKAVR